MATYCFRCDGAHDPDCPSTVRLTTRDPSAINKGEPHHFVRDYRAENVGVSIADLKAARNGTGGLDEVSRLMLPSNKDFVGPGDPDGVKGMRQWRDDHQPKAGNTQPLWPGEVEKRVF